MCSYFGEAQVTLCAVDNALPSSLYIHEQFNLILYAFTNVLRHQCANKFPKAHKQSSASSLVRREKDERNLQNVFFICSSKRKKVTVVLKIFVS